MIKIGYLTNLNVKKKEIDERVLDIYIKCIDLELKALICIGISDNYLITDDFTKKLGNKLKEKNIIFRFVVGNQDMYYPDSEYAIDKETKFRSIKSLYLSNTFNLVNHHISYNNLRITGYDTWYDYTMYRGRDITLKDITKKRKGFYYNRDNTYITSKDDYIVGVSDTFDVRYTRETYESMISGMNRFTSKYSKPSFEVAVMYFLPTKVMLGDNKRNYYKDTFQGSIQYMKPLEDFGITECIIGSDSCRVDRLKYHNISFIHPYSSEIMGVEYNV